MIKRIEYVKVIVVDNDETIIEKATDEIKMLKKELETWKKVDDELLTPEEAAKF